MATYQSMLGQSFDPMWRDGIVHALTGALEGVALGPLQPSATLQRLPVVQQAMRAQNAQPLEASIQASRQGTPYAGVVYVLNMPFPEDPRSGVFTMGLIVAPPQLVQPAIEANLQMALSTRPNPQFEQAYAEINRRVLNQMQVDHQRRMANNQAQFDAHQRRMKANSDAFDARNRQWMQDFRNSGGASGGSGNGYSHQDAYIDTIRETETFYDPDSGQNVQLDGYQDRTFTDNLGNFYRTDDPSFDPNSMQGSWQEVQPLQPGQ